MSFFDGCTGSQEDAFVPDFTVIPNGTTAPALFKSIMLMEKDSQYTGHEKFYEITWKIASGEFKDQQVTQKIKCFTGTPDQIKRAKNMLLLLIKLCKLELTHDLEPSLHELAKMQGKIVGIKIREWSMQKSDGSGYIEGNFVSELHEINDKFVTQTGKKLENKKQENMQQQELAELSADNENGEIPF